MILAFDTETTGLPMWKEPSDDPRQPHVIQLAAVLLTTGGEEVETLSTIIQPGEGAVMEPEAFDAHGISLAKAREVGAHPVETMLRFFAMANRATVLVGHNVSFDIRMNRIMAARHLGFKWDPATPSFCTMKRSSDIVNLPPTPAMVRSGRNWPKPPKLAEAIKHFFNEDLEGAHDALVDVRASLRVFQHLTNVLGLPLVRPDAKPRAPRKFGNDVGPKSASTDPFAEARAALAGASN